MKVKSLLKISFLIAITHCVVGTMIARFDLNPVLEFIFLPYTFIAGMSYFAGWDSLSFFLELISFLFITTALYPLVLFIDRRAQPTAEEDAK